MRVYSQRTQHIKTVLSLFNNILTGNVLGRCNQTEIVISMYFNVVLFIVHICEYYVYTCIFIDFV